MYYDEDDEDEDAMKRILELNWIFTVIILNFFSVQLQLYILYYYIF
jgi:hypothetical protein